MLRRRSRVAGFTFPPDLPKVSELGGMLVATSGNVNQIELIFRQKRCSDARGSSRKARAALRAAAVRIQNLPPDLRSYDRMNALFRDEGCRRVSKLQK